MKKTRRGVAALMTWVLVAFLRAHSSDTVPASHLPAGPAAAELAPAHFVGRRTQLLQEEGESQAFWGQPGGGQVHSDGPAAETSLEPQPAADAGQALRGAPLVFLSFANAAFSDFLLNWALSVQQLGVPYLVAALDDETAAACLEHGIPHHNLHIGNSTFFRANLGQFRKMGSLKVAFVLAVLEELDVGTAVVSDTDVVWLRDPSDYLQRHPAADWLISTDCLSHQVEVKWRPGHNQPRCGHVPGNNWGRAYNTGAFAVRNRPAALGVLRMWRDFLQDPNRTTVWHGSFPHGVTDQLALNMLFEEGLHLSRAVPEDPRSIWAVNDTLRLHALPVALFPGGHAAFVQRLPWELGVTPYMVHATFQRYSSAQHREGKRGRFREFGMWLLDEQPYYEEGQFLVYNNDVRQYIAELEQSRHNGSMAPLYKHLVAASYQLSIFRDALAIARVTNRILVLAESYCYCDYDHVPHVLETCRIRGTDMSLPFRCPADYIFQIPAMDAEPGLRYRMPGFLDLAQVSGRIRRSQLAVNVVPQRPATLAAPHELVGHAAEVWPGITASELAQALQPLAGAAVLNIRGMQPGLFGGFQRREKNAQFDFLFKRLTADSYWCCAAVRLDLRRISFPYRLPMPLTAGWQPWAPPILEPPHWCEAVTEENREFVAYANHPCQFLRNATAAAVAARIS